MQKANHYVVIMAGGIGSRFWPFSRTDHPKQFHDVLGAGQSLIQMTADRYQGICPQENIFVVTNASYKALVKEHLPFLDDSQILLEPSGRNTAPCIAYACQKIQTANPEAAIVVSPSDHIIQDVDNFRQMISQGLEKAAETECLVTLGIQPDHPHTGYGYIQYMDSGQDQLLKKVRTFTEKPDTETAHKFLDSGEFVWNSGIFIWNARAIDQAFAQYSPDIYELFAEGPSKYYTEEEPEFIDSVYAQVKNISIDYAVMEKADNVYVILCDFGWSDLGSWKSLYEISDKDQNQNVVEGNAMVYDTAHSIIKTPKDKLVVVQGLQDYIVAEYDNVIMICHKREEQKVKQFVADAKAGKNSGYV